MTDPEHDAPRCRDCGDTLIGHIEINRGRCTPCDADTESAKNVNEIGASIYDSLDQCILDIMANTDCPFLSAVVAAGKVFHENWEYTDAPERGVAIAPPETPDRYVIIRMEG